MRRFRREAIEPLRMDYEDEEVFVESNSFGFQKTMAYQSVTTVSSGTVQHATTSMQSENSMHTVNSANHFVFDANGDNPSPLVRQFSYGLNRKRSRKKDFRLR